MAEKYMRREWSYHDWDGDPRTLPLSVVRRLRRDPAYARSVFSNVTEAFEAGLSIGYLAAQQAAEPREA